MIKNIKEGLGEEKYKKFKNTCFKILLLLFILSPIGVLAEDDPLAVINNLSELIFALTRAIGGILVVFSVTQLGLSFKSHDPSQRANAVMGVLGGVIIFCTKQILKIITGG